MAKRIIAVLLAALMGLSSLPVQTRGVQTGGYEIALAAEKEALSPGDMAVVRVVVTAEEAHDYNAYDLKLSYDTACLALESAVAADPNGEVADSDGRIRVKGYGKSKNLSQTAVELTFKAIAPGKANVTLIQGKIDKSLHAGSQNAPDAAIGKGTVTFSVAGFTVTGKGEGLVLSSAVAMAGEDYTFRMSDHRNYDATITVTIGGVNVSKLVACDEKNGIYTIPGDLIDGNIEIDAQRTPREYTVTIVGGNVTGEKKAVYNTDYTFRLERETGYLYTVEITIDKATFTEYKVEGDTYTIPGTAITGKIKIKVTKTEDDSGKVTVTFAGTGGKDGSGPQKAKWGEEYSFKIRKKKDYIYSLHVYVQGKKVPYEYDGELDTYYIPGQYITGNLVIVIHKATMVEVTEYVTLDKQSLYLIVYNGRVPEGQVPKYDGKSMYWSDRYQAYVWLIQSADPEKKMKKTAGEQITLAEGSPTATIDYSGDVNMTHHRDEADARLVQEMYEGKHTLAFTQMQQLLNADVYTDRKLDVRDAAAIVNGIF